MAERRMFAKTIIDSDIFLDDSLEFPPFVCFASYNTLILLFIQYIFYFVKHFLYFYFFQKMT